MVDQPLVYRCLALTGTLETSRRPPDCFSAVAGNFDGQGLSFGCLQWNLGQGTLQRLLSMVDTANPSVLTACFGDRSAELRTILHQDRQNQVEWAFRIQTGGFSLLEPWKGAFRQLGRTDTCRTVQAELASDLYRRALKLCSILQVWSERAVALMFDIKVQMGGFEQETIDAIRTQYATMTSDPARPEGEQARLEAVAHQVAFQANPTFSVDVRNRKMTIARGNGTVHGIPIELEAQFGIRLAPFAAT